jgi:hypothetical protein
MKRLLVPLTTFTVFVGFPGTAAAESNGPECGGSAPPVKGIVVLTTIAIVLVFVAVMAAAVARRR